MKSHLPNSIAQSPVEINFICEFYHFCTSYFNFKHFHLFSCFTTLILINFFLFMYKYLHNGSIIIMKMELKIKINYGNNYLALLLLKIFVRLPRFFYKQYNWITFMHHLCLSKSFELIKYRGKTPLRKFMM